MIILKLARRLAPKNNIFKKLNFWLYAFNGDRYGWIFMVFISLHKWDRYIFNSWEQINRIPGNKIVEHKMAGNKILGI